RAPKLLGELAEDPHPEVHKTATEALPTQQSASTSKATDGANTNAKTQDTNFIGPPPDKDLDDVAAMESIKDRLREQVIVPFEGGASYEKYDINLISGILFHG